MFIREEYYKNRDVNDAELRDGKTVLSSKPRSLIVTLTSDCNLRCTMCDVWKKSWHLPERAAREVRDLIPYLLKVTWQGGEVFLSPYFRELFTAAAETEGVEQAVVTNGLLIDENWARTLARKNVTLIVSIDGVRKETYEGIRQGADFGLLCRNLERLAAIKPPEFRLVMQMVIGKDSWRDLDLVHDFISRYKIDRLQLLPLRPGETGREALDVNGPETVEAARRIAALEEQGKAEGFEVLSVLPKPPASGRSAIERKDEKHQALHAPAQPVKCRWPWQQMIIDRFGEVRIHCFCDAVIGDINTQRLEDIWNGGAMARARERMLAGDLSGCTPRCASGAIGADELGLWR